MTSLVKIAKRSDLAQVALRVAYVCYVYRWVKLIGLRKGGALGVYVEIYSRIDLAL